MLDQLFDSTNNLLSLKPTAVPKELEIQDLPPVSENSIRSLVSSKTTKSTLNLSKEIVLLLAFHLITYCQPAGDANTRTTRLFIDRLAAQNGLYISDDLWKLMSFSPIGITDLDSK
jgi:hypothetical protein